jgi:HNH endonuclease
MGRFVAMTILEYCKTFKGGAHLSAREAAAIGLAYGKVMKHGWPHNQIGQTMLRAEDVERMREFQALGRKPAKAEVKRMTQGQRLIARLAKQQPASVPPRGIYPNSDAFLQSYEWRTMRMRILKRDGAVCACCGASRATGAVLHVDHIKSRRIFPQLALDPANLQVLCHECNHGKGNWDMTDWRTAHTVSR